MSYRAPRLKGLDLDRSKDSPEILFNELTEASRKMDGIVARIQEYTRGRQVSVTKLEAQLSQLTQEEGECVNGLKAFNKYHYQQLNISPRSSTTSVITSKPAINDHFKTGQRTSVITSKPAINDHFKTGQRSRIQDMKLFYRASGSLSKLLLLLLRYAPCSIPTSGRGAEYFLFFLHRKILCWFWSGRRGEAPAECGAEPLAKRGGRNHCVPPAVVAAALVRQLRGPHLSTCP